uniref:Uncharacterized protein n=1 Tax=Knipowitschia caucasica TaxID=637954 RepID=A0AAV2MNG9_KNICA
MDGNTSKAMHAGIGLNYYRNLPQRQALDSAAAACCCSRLLAHPLRPHLQERSRLEPPGAAGPVPDPGLKLKHREQLREN